MPTKKAGNGKRYTIDGKTFTWTTEDGDLVAIPLRIKVKVIRKLSDQNLDVDGMLAVVEAIAPDQGAAIDEMDVVTDFQPMFEAWQEEYNALSGASLGESSGSSTSSTSTAQPSTTTGAPASA